MGVDLWVFQAINEFARATPWLHGPMVVYTNYGIVLLALLLLGGWWLARQQANPRVIAAALWAPVGMLAALGVNQPISSAVGEARPYAVLSHILVLAHRSMDPSFPSDHAVTAGAVAAGVLLAAAEGADGGVIDGADGRGVGRPRRRVPDGAWSLGWRVGRQGGGGVVIRR